MGPDSARMYYHWVDIGRLMTITGFDGFDGLRVDSARTRLPMG